MAMKEEAVLLRRRVMLATFMALALILWFSSPADAQVYGSDDFEEAAASVICARSSEYRIPTGPRPARFLHDPWADGSISLFLTET